MIGPVITRGLGFPAHYLVTAGLASGAVVIYVPPPSVHRIYRVDQAGAGGDIFRVKQAGTGGEMFRNPTGGSPKVFRS